MNILLSSLSTAIVVSELISSEIVYSITAAFSLILWNTRIIVSILIITGNKTVVIYLSI